MSLAMSTAVFANVVTASACFDGKASPICLLLCQSITHTPKIVFLLYTV